MKLSKAYFGLIIVFFPYIKLCIWPSGFFQNLKKAADETYGYSPESPILIKKSLVEQDNLDLTLKFLSDLRTNKGKKLEIVERSTIPNPNYKKPKIIFRNVITGEQLNKGNGPSLEMFILRSDDRKDTVKLFFNRFIKSDLIIPTELYRQR